MSDLRLSLQCVRGFSSSMILHHVWRNISQDLNLKWWSYLHQSIFIFNIFFFC